MPALMPTGTVTFLFTDVEGSTELYHRLGAHFEELLDEHRAICRAAFEAFDGAEVACPGDGFIVAFGAAADAVLAAAQAQREITSFPWPPHADVRVRMGLHTGEARLTSTGGTYVGMALHEASRVGGAGVGGQTLLSEATYRLVEHSLPPGLTAVSLGAQQLKGFEAARTLYELSGDGLPSGFPPLRTLEAIAGNLPPAMSTLLGRDSELHVIAASVREHSLTTLLGPGGTGKTSLALDVARSLGDSFGDGAWFVDLTPMPAGAGASSIADAIGSALMINVSTTAALGAALKTRNALVVLDNCEHVIAGAAAALAALVPAAPLVRWIATSREALGLARERTISVAPLAADAAARLFAARAAEVVPGYETGEDAASVARICERLDHLPLAIELAAKRVAVLSPGAIADRLDDRFSLLTGGARDVPARQRTLEATVHWSYSLLAEEDRVLLRRLSVFVGGCDLDAAEAVCGTPPLEPAGVLDLMAGLVDRSLVTADRGQGEVRYRLLETIREFASDRLDESGERDELRHRHLAWFADRSWEALDRIERGTIAGEFRSLAANGDNLKAAVMWALDGGDLDAGLRLATGVGIHGMESGRGHYYASRGWIDGLLARGAGSDDPGLRCQALVSAANTAGDQGALDASERYVEQALALADRHSLPRPLRSQALAMAGLDLMHADPLRAMALHEESAALVADGVAPGFRIYALGFLAISAMLAGRLEDARVAAETALDEARRLGLDVGVANSLNRLARVALREGEVVDAGERADEAVAAAQRAGAPGQLAVARTNQALAAYFAGDPARAFALADQATTEFGVAGETFAVVELWSQAAILCLMVGDLDFLRTAVARLVVAVELADDTKAVRSTVEDVLRAAQDAGQPELVATLRR